MWPEDSTYETSYPDRRQAGRKVGLRSLPVQQGDRWQQRGYSFILIKMILPSVFGKSSHTLGKVIPKYPQGTVSIWDKNSYSGTYNNEQKP